MKKQEIITEYYKLQQQLINLKRQEISENRDKEVEENFSTLVVGKPKVKILKKQYIS